MEGVTSRETRDLSALILLHTFLWTGLSALARDSLPADTLEAIAWGLQWEWGYDKHPFLAAWLAGTVGKLTGHVGWEMYLLGSARFSCVSGQCGDWP